MSDLPSMISAIFGRLAIRLDFAFVLCLFSAQRMQSPLIHSIDRFTISHVARHYKTLISERHQHGFDNDIGLAARAKVSR